MKLLDQLNYIENVIEMAVSEGTLTAEKAKQMSPKEKFQWYDDLLRKDDALEAIIDDAIDAGHHGEHGKHV